MDEPRDYHTSEVSQMEKEKQTIKEQTCGCQGGPRRGAMNGRLGLAEANYYIQNE